MPRDGSGVYSKPAGTTASPNTTIESSKYNSQVDDMVTDANTARPITAGGTGRTTARLLDGTWRFENTADPTKLLAFDLSGQTTALTRTQKTPNYNGTLASQALGTAIASAATTDIGAASGSTVHITGTTTITALGTADAGIQKTLIFDGALTFTHNGTSLILPGAVNIPTAAGDIAIMVSEGSGNWRCVNYQLARRAADAGWDDLGRGSLSAASELSLINAGSYVRLRVKAFLTVSSDGATIRFYTRTGGTVDTVVNGYDFLRIYSEAGANGTNSGTTDFAPLTLSNIGNAARRGINFSLEVEGLNKTEYAWMKLDSSETTSAGGRSKTLAELRRLSIVARDGFLIQPSAGTISGWYSIEGMRG